MAIADNQIVHPAFVDTPRRSLPVELTTTKILTGRWVVRNSSGNAEYPGTAGMPGAYWVLEGTVGHIGTASEFSGTDPNNVSTNYITYPSNAESKTITAVYGSFVATVGPEGVVPGEYATIAVGDKLTVDTSGRLTEVNDPTVDAVYAIVEAVTVTSSLITSLTFRAVGAQGSVGTAS